MTALREALIRTLRTEWRFTYLSARREWSRRYAARLFARELGKGLRDVPAYAAEIRRARTAG